MKFSGISITFAAVAITTSNAMPTIASPLAPCDGTNWSLKAYGLDTGVCKNAFRLYEGTATSGCTNLDLPATAVELVTDLDCVITLYDAEDCPRGTGKGFGPRVADCAPHTPVRSFLVDCGVV